MILILKFWLQRSLLKRILFN